MSGNAPVRRPTFSRRGDWFSYFFDTGTILFGSAMLAFMAAAMTVIATDYMSDPGWRHHRHHAHHASLVLPMIAFAVTFVFSIVHYNGPDWTIGRRLRRVAADAGLVFRFPAYSVVANLLWTNFPDLPISAVAGGWTLTAADDPSRILTISHTRTEPDSGHLQGVQKLERVGVGLFCLGADARKDFSQPVRDRLGAMGFQILQCAQGTVVCRRTLCGWRRGQRAVDLVTIDGITELWRLCSGKTSANLTASGLSS